MNTFQDILPDITEPSIVHSVDLADMADAIDLLWAVIMEEVGPTLDEVSSAKDGPRYLLKLLSAELRRVNKAGIDRGGKLQNDIASGLLILTDATEGDVSAASKP